MSIEDREEHEEREELAAAFAFLGNSLLKPMSQTSQVGLDVAFWEAFPTFESDAVCEAVDELGDFAKSMEDRDDSVTQLSVEFTRLFVGPPKPAAMPWESYYQGENVTSGFGAATFAMQDQLRAHGLQVGGDSNQLADHIGIELLLLSEICRKADNSDLWEEAKRFATAHPKQWVDAFAMRVASAEPCGYFVRLVALAKALLALF